MTASDVETHCARKIHHCEWCNEKIVPGEQYKRYRIWDGDDADTMRLHAECYQAMLDEMKLRGEYFIEWTMGEFERPKKAEVVDG